MKRFYKRKFWFMVLPSIVLFLLVIIVPFIEGVIYSFTEWRGSYFVGGEHWWNALVGLKNYTSIFKSKDFLQSLGYTAIYAVLAVIAQNVVSLLLALMIKKLPRARDFSERYCSFHMYLECSPWVMYGVSYLKMYFHRRCSEQTVWYT